MKMRILMAAVMALALAGPLAAQPVEGPNGNYYEHVPGPISWNDARTAAEGMSFGGSMGYLATVTSAEENTFVATLGAADTAYLGGNDIDVEGTWTWVTGEPWSFTAWGPGEPNNSGNEDCLHYRPDGLWNDIPCGTAYNRGFVVEYDAADFVTQANTFATSVMAAGGGDAGSPDVTISCNGGIPLSQTAAAGTTFTVTELNVGDVCTIELADDLESGWIADGYLSGPAGSEVEDLSGACTFNIGAATAWGCIVEAVPAPVDFSVTVDWEISADADPGTGDGAMVAIYCEDYNGSTSTTMPAGPGVTTPIVVTGLVPDPDDSSYCSASLENVGSAVDADDSACDDVSIEVGGGDASCMIYATAFYEGIPTLSQYGMAVMALLMLGVGFVGFRRFI
ncbi:MAG: IPTL-CTERM sorting domain-containing protein [Xanthomonadales bacterium]|jgi:hypothetical protein|nr:IPTL-CTERM sorting domain-containing protein [Xanthomonadales bacterium]